MQLDIALGLEDASMNFHLIDRDKVKVKLPEAALNRVKEAAEDKLTHVILPAEKALHIAFLGEAGNDPYTLEAHRKAGHEALSQIRHNKSVTIQIFDHMNDADAVGAFIEGLLLSDYHFEVLKSEPKGSDATVIRVKSSVFSAKALDEMVQLTYAVHWARDLVNLPLSHLTAEGFARAVATAGDRNGFSVEVFTKQKIESLKMGGLLAVNRGSIDPPTFTIAEWKPEKAVNKKPVVLVGKGVVYDTGGISLKPTANSMDFMKSDMAGAAMMAAVLDACARLKLPIHTMALIPATDNRPDGNAIVPGDVITMYDGTTVEVKNTDAEGRLILADALSYAKKFEPSLVIDAATLTGAAVRAIGTYGCCVMGTADDDIFEELNEAGYETYERNVRFPLWPEYEEELKSDVADMSNLGKGEGGQVSAAMFLKHFTDYPWMHIDIAGPSFMHSKSSYRGKGGTGTGVRLLVRFMKKHFDL